jgi:hypothetical protein
VEKQQERKRRKRKTRNGLAAERAENRAKEIDGREQKSGAKA